MKKIILCLLLTFAALAFTNCTGRRAAESAREEAHRTGAAENGTNDISHGPHGEPETQTPTPTPQPPPTDEMWHRHGDMTFSQMRESIATYGAEAFKDATGWDIVFDNPGEILSIADPFVLARGYSSNMQTFVHVLFAYSHWRQGGGWRVEGYGLWDEWRTHPQLTRGLWEGRRYVEASTVNVRFYGIVDWGGGEVARPVRVGIPGDTFAEEFVRLFNENVGESSWVNLKMLDMWFIGGNRLYVNLCGAVMDAQGSATGYAILVSLYNTLFSIPGVDEVVVLVDGRAEASSDHIGFSHIDRRDDLQIQTFLRMGRRQLSAYHAGVFAAVLQDEMPFMYFTYTHAGHVDWVTGQVLSWRPFSDDPIFLREYLDSAPYIFTYDIERIAVVDMDGSGVPELVLASRWDGSSMILHYGGDGTVYGFGIPQRQFQALKEDGNFLQLSWMQDWGSIARVNFVRDGAHANMVLEFVYEWEQVGPYGYENENMLYLNGEMLIFEEGWAMVERARAHHHSKEYVIWHPFAEFLETFGAQ